MRLIISVAMYLLSLTLILLGIAERTVWAPPETKALSLTIDGAKPLVVLPQELLSRQAGTPVIEVSGSGRVFLASGREADVNAWIGGSAKTSIFYDKSSKKLGYNSVEGTAPSANPAGSDLWRTERSADTSVAAKVDTAEDAAVILASDGFGPGPSNIKIKWKVDYDLTPSNILLYSGQILLAATIIFNFVVYRQIRNSQRPRRRLPKAPQGPRSRPKRRESTIPKRGRRVAGRNHALLPASMLALSLVTGCAPAATAPTPTATTNEATIAKPAALQLGQIRKIVTSVATVAKSADSARNSGQLAARFAGPALEMRDAAYWLLKKTNKAPVPVTIYSSPLTLSLPAATDTWPRVMMVVTGTKEKLLPSMLVLRQMSPREQYKVWYSTTLVSGVKLPEVPSVTEGSVPVAPDSAYLSTWPIKLPEVYGSLIDKGSDSPDFAKFDLKGDSFYSQIAKIQKDQIASLSKASLTYQHVLSDPEPLGLATVDGGALVAVYMKDITTIKPNKRNSGITVNKLEQAALGAKGSIKGVVSTYGDMLLFYVPAIGQTSKIRLLGWQAGLIKVKSL